jgi:hypothetical protein
MFSMSSPQHLRRISWKRIVLYTLYPWFRLRFRFSYQTFSFYFTFTWPCIVTNFFLIKPTDALISQIYFCQETLRFSGSSSAHHKDFSAVHSALVYVIKTARHITVPNVQWKTPDDGHRNCLKHVDFLNKNKFGKLVRLLVLLKRNFSVYSYIYSTLCVLHATPIIMKNRNDEAFPCVNFRTLLLLPDFLIFYTIHLHMNYASTPNS